MRLCFILTLALNSIFPCLRAPLLQSLLRRRMQTFRQVLSISMMLHVNRCPFHGFVVTKMLLKSPSVSNGSCSIFSADFQSVQRKRTALVLVGNNNATSVLFLNSVVFLFIACSIRICSLSLWY